MQKVEGSNPFIRSQESPANRGFVFAGGVGSESAPGLALPRRRKHRREIDAIVSAAERERLRREVDAALPKDERERARYSRTDRNDAEAQWMSCGNECPRERSQLNR